MRSNKTDQENFWAGQFGTEYIGRNQGEELLASNLHFFSRIFRSVDPVKNILEVGANIGMNLKALQLLAPKCKLSGIEINNTAAKELKKNIPEVTVLNKSLYDFDIPSASYDFVFTKGVLIHLDPSTLDVVYKKLVGASNRYVLIAEYYNRTPVSIPYRGHRDKLFKRDFAGELLDQYSDLRLVDYGFSYHRDRAFPQDDISWFLLQKNPS